MTNEQIKQNADNYTESLMCENLHRTMYSSIDFITGAHSRDEEIKELKRKNIEYFQSMEYWQKRARRLNIRRTKQGENTKELRNELNKLRNELNKLRNPWIRVEDRLPKGEDNPDEYNAPHRARSSRNVIIRDGVIVKMGYYSYARMRWEWNGGEIKVTHWMPDPELKEGE